MIASTQIDEMRCEYFNHLIALFFIASWSTCKDAIPCALNIIGLQKGSVYFFIRYLLRIFLILLRIKDQIFFQL